MYCMYSMRHLLVRSLHTVSDFKGDGRAVAIQTRSQPTDAHPSASFIESLPLISPSKQLTATKHRPSTHVTRQRCQSDSRGVSRGHPPSPLSSSISPPPDDL